MKDDIFYQIDTIVALCALVILLTIGAVVVLV